MVSWFNRNRGMALGVAIMGISVAGVVMPTVVTWLGENVHSAAEALSIPGPGTTAKTSFGLRPVPGCKPLKRVD